MQDYVQSFAADNRPADFLSTNKGGGVSPALELQQPPQKEVTRSGRTRVEPARFHAAPSTRSVASNVNNKPDQPLTIIEVVASGKKYTVTESHSASFIKASVAAFKVSILCTSIAVLFCFPPCESGLLFLFWGGSRA